jgi:hypothetical protein
MAFGGWLRWFWEGAYAALSGIVATRTSGPLYTATRSILVDPTYIYLDNDHLIEWSFEIPDDATRVLEAAAGLSLTGFISETVTGSAIGSSTVSMTEASSKPGTYYGIIDYGTINTDLAGGTPSLEGQRVFEIVTDGQNLRLYKELIVKRRAA